MKYIGYTLLLVAGFLLLGTVGGIDQNTIPFEEGIYKCIISLVLAIASVMIIKKCEEKEND